MNQEAKALAAELAEVKRKLEECQRDYIALARDFLTVNAEAKRLEELLEMHKEGLHVG
jgi:chromosome segregation ATPase